MIRTWLAGVPLDAMHAARALVRQPLFATVVMCSLALGIGSIAALVSFIEATLLRPLNVEAAEDLVQFHWESRQWFPERNRFAGTGVIAPAPKSPTFHGDAFDAVRGQAEGAAEVFAFSYPSAINAVVPDSAIGARLQIVSGNYFSVLKLRPAAGRLFTPDDDRPSAPPPAVISHQFWKVKLGEQANVLGKQLSVDGVTFTIVGIGPAGFRGVVIAAPAPPDIWIPIAFADRFSWVQDPRSLWWLCLMGRLRPDVTHQQLAERVQRAFQTSVVASARPPSHDVPQIRVRPARRGLSDDSADDVLENATVLAAIFSTLLVALCMNVGSLLLARSMARRDEIAVRLALGAHRLRLVGQLVLEGLILAAGGAIGGVIAAFWAAELFEASTLLPAAADMRPNLMVIAAIVLVTCAVGLGISLVPALRVTGGRYGVAINRSVRRAGTTSRANRAILTVQVATAVVLLIGAGVFIRTLGRWGRVDPGFNADRLLLLDIKPESLGYDEGPASPLVERLLARLRTVPGVVAATASGPFLGNPWPGRIVIDRTVQNVDPRWLPVSTDFFQVLELPLRAGRTFTAADAARPPRVTVIDEDLAEAVFGATSPIGQRLRFDQGGPEVEVIGVVGRMSLGGIRPASRHGDNVNHPLAPMRPTLYFPASTQRADLDPANLEQRGTYRDSYATTIAVRFSKGAASVVPDVRRAIADVEANLAVVDPKTVAQIAGERLEPTRIAAVIWLVFGSATLCLTILGLYGIVSYSVTQRTREIAVRLALGARPNRVVTMLMHDTAAITLFGVVLGVLVSAVMTQIIQSRVFGASAYDPVAVCAAAALVAAVCATAAAIPARRALAVEPSTALRWE